MSSYLTEFDVKDIPYSDNLQYQYHITDEGQLVYNLQNRFDKEPEAEDFEILSSKFEESSSKKTLHLYKVTDSGVHLKKGEQVGMFKMGSSIGLVFESPQNFEFKKQPGERVLLGERLFDQATSEK